MIPPCPFVYYFVANTCDMVCFCKIRDITSSMKMVVLGSESEIF